MHKLACFVAYSSVLRAYRLIQTPSESTDYTETTEHTEKETLTKRNRASL